jgi:chromosome segregation ATPase
MKALKRMTKEELIQELKELIQELTNTRKQLKGAREDLNAEKGLRRSEVERVQHNMKDKLDTISSQYREWKALAEDNQRKLNEVARDRDFLRCVLEKMSR